jgi:hypothetical protein
LYHRNRAGAGSDITGVYVGKRDNISTTSILSPSKSGESGIQKYEASTVRTHEDVCRGTSWRGEHFSYYSYILGPRGYPGEAIELGLIACG